MVNRRYTLSKEERLSWKRYIDLLFAKGQSFVAFPLRVVYLAVEEETLAPVSILVSVPKKKFRRAVKRNLIKRQVREAYRVRKYDLIDPLTGKNKRMLVAFLYLDKEIHPFADMEKDTGFVQVHTYLFRICCAGSQKTWSGKGIVFSSQTYSSLPSLGRKRI